MRKIIIAIAILTAIALSFGTAKALGNSGPMWTEGSNYSSLASGSAWECDQNFTFTLNWSSPAGTDLPKIVMFQLGRPTGTYTNYTNATVPMIRNASTLFFVNLSQEVWGPGGDYNFTWYAQNYTEHENSTKIIWNFTVAQKAMPAYRGGHGNDTYINFDQAFQYSINITDDDCWWKRTNFTVKFRAATSHSTDNYTAVLDHLVAGDFNYTFNWSSHHLGSASVNSTRVNITYVYIDGNANYSAHTQTATGNYSDYGRTSNLTSVTIPTTASYNEVMTVRVNYTTYDLVSMLQHNCTINFAGIEYDLLWGGVDHVVYITNPETDTGTDGWYLNCTNTSYQTQISSGSIYTYGLGGGGGGGGGGTATTLPQSIAPTTTYCGDGTCNGDEAMWNCWKDCNPFKDETTSTSSGSQPLATGDTNTTTETSESISPIIVLVIIVVGIFVLKKL